MNVWNALTALVLGCSLVGCQGEVPQPGETGASTSGSTESETDTDLGAPQPIPPDGESTDATNDASPTPDGAEGPILPPQNGAGG